MEKFMDSLKQTISDVINEIVHVEDMEIDEYDNLIELGVDSLSLVNINSKLKERFGVQIQVSQFFGGVNTIADITKFVRENSDAALEERADFSGTAESVAVTEKTVWNGAGPEQQTKISGTTVPDELIQQISQMVYQAMAGNQESGSQKPVVGLVNTMVSAGSGSKAPKKKSKSYVAYKKIDLDRKERSARVKNALQELTGEYNGKTGHSKEIAEKIRMKHADWRNVAGFRLDYKELIYQLVASDCFGSKIVDVDGNQYIDIAMGFGVNFFGYKPEFILEAVKKEIDKGFPLSMISENVGIVSELLCELTGMERAAYFNSGSEAVMAAVRIARAKTLKSKIVYFAGAYHGTFDGVLGIEGEDYTHTRPMSVGVLEHMVSDLMILDYDDEKSLRIIEENADEIAGVLLESVQSRNPGLQPREFVTELRSITEKNNIALIFDEMITGFRISPGGAQEFYGVSGDIATYGKILGGGMPIGAVAGKAEFMDCLDGGMWNYGDGSYPPNEAHRTFAGGTFCHHPLSMAAAEVVLKKIKAEKDLIYPEINRKTQYLAESLNEFLEAENVPMKVSYFGSLFRFEFQGNLEIFYYYMLMEGIYIWEGRNCFLSTAHTDEDIEQIIETVKKVVRRMQGVFLPEAPGIRPLTVSERQSVMIAAMSFEKETSQYNESVLFETVQEMDASVLTSCVRKVIARHGMLDVSLDEDNIRLNTVREPFQLETYTCESVLTEDEIGKLANLPFDLYHERGFKLYLLQDSKSRYLLFCANHLFVDGYSIVQMMEEVFAYYNAAVSSVPFQLKPAVGIQEYETRKAQIIKNLDREEIEEFWSGYFQNAYELSLPCMREQSGSSCERVSGHIDKVEYLDLKAAASAFKCSPFVLMLSAAHILLHKISGQKKIVVGVPFAGQLLLSDCSVVGYIDKVIPVITEVFSELRVNDIISQNMRLFSKLDDTRYMLDEICSEETMRSEPKINVLFNMDTLPQLEVGREEVKMRTLVQKTAMYDLMINLTFAGNEIVIDFDYNSAKFSEKQVRSWLSGYRTVLFRMGADKNTRISKVDCIDEETEKLLSAAVKHVRNNHTEFLRETAEGRTAESTYVVLDGYHNLVPFGSVGMIGLYSENRELMITPFYGSLNEDCELEVIDRKDHTFIRNGIRIGRSRIEKVLSGIGGVLRAAVYPDDKNAIAADLYCDSDFEIKLGELKQICLKNLPSYLCPVRFYLIKGEERQLLQAADPDAENKAIRDICMETMGIADMDTEEDFISLGINSIQILKFFAAVQEKFGVKLNFRDFKKEFTVSAVRSVIEQQKRGRTEIQTEMLPVAKKDYYAASCEQKRLFVEYQLNREDKVYNIPAVVYIEGKISPEKMKKALTRLLERHEALRTSFSVIDGEIVQVIHENAEFEFQVTDTGLAVIDAAYIDAQMREFVRPFALEEVPLVRIHRLNSTQEKSVMLFDVHHIVFDGFSENVLLHDLICFLEEKELPKLSVQYKDYAEWQKSYLAGEAMLEQENYWRGKFSNGIPGCKLDADLTGNSENGNRKGRCELELTRETADEISRFCKEANCTPFLYMLAAFGYTLKLQTGGDNVLFGITLEGRNSYQVQDMIGLFVTNLPFLVEFEDALTVKDYLDTIKQEFYSFMDNAEVPLEKIIEMCGRKSSNKDEKIFDINFAYQDFHQEYFAKDVQMIPVEYSVEGNMFDLDCEIIHARDNYKILFKYNRALYCESTINRFLQYFSRCLEQFAQKYDSLLSDVSLLNGVEADLMLHQFNATVAEYPKEKTIMDLFEEQVKKTPDRIAAVMENRELTYCELNQMANALAYQLRAGGIKPDDFVAILAERSMEMLIAIYAVLKSGGAYVPIDPAYPKERIQFILEDSKPKAVLTYHTEIPTDIPVIDLANPEIYRSNPENLERISGPKDLAYCIYTSGTTGKPKGVMIEQRGLVNYIWWAKKMYIKKEQEIFPLFSSVSFDLTVTTIFTPLVSGGKIILYREQGEGSSYVLYDIMADNQVTVMKLTPAHLALLKDLDNRNSSVQRLIVGGEDLKVNLANEIQESFGGTIEIYNEYGPTETVVGCMIYQFDPVQDTRNSVSIGVPADNVQIYLLDKNLNPVPFHVLGEMYISGEGVARGYLNRPDLNQTKFLDHPFLPGRRMYRTGDLARFIDEKRIEYAGRADEQVKIRGFRIELGEIESRIREMDGIKDCVVIAREDGNCEKAIYAYYVSDSRIGVSEVRDFLIVTLPNYMIPMYMLQIDAIPLTKNGKLDKHALPDIEMAAGHAYVAPSSEMEKNICDIYSGILNVAPVGVNDNFFEIGGHSLSAVRLINQLETKFGVKVAFDTLFHHPSPGALAKNIAGSCSVEKEIPVAEAQEYYPMSSSQKRMFLINQYDEKEIAYNMTGSIEFDGEFDVERMKAAIIKLTERHEILRTGFQMIDGEPVQVVQQDAVIDFEITERAESETEQVYQEFLRPFDLGRAPLMRELVLKVSEDRHILFLDIHHMISDGISNTILLKEMAELYEGKALEPLRVQYKDCSEWMRKQDMSAQEQYWLNEFADEIPVLDLPLDYARPTEQSFEGDSVEVLLGDELGGNIKEIAKKNQATDYMVFLSAAMLLLSRYSRQEDIVVGSLISGRTHRDTEDVMGMFINTVALRGKVDQSHRYTEFLDRMKEKCLQAYNYQDYPFDELIEAVGVQRDMSRNPLFSVMIEMQNMGQMELMLDGKVLPVKEWDNAISKFDLSFIIKEESDGFHVKLEYCTALFLKETAMRIADHYTEILKQITENPDQKMEEIEMITQAEKVQVLEKFNPKEVEGVRDRTVVDLFEEQVQKTPDRVAVVYQDHMLTYRELNEKANALANDLRRYGVGPNDFVVVIAERCNELMIAIYGILKAGGAYVPVNVTYPNERIAYIIEDCRPKAVILAADERSYDSEEIPVIDLKRMALGRNPENPERLHTPEHYSHCFYTSGTTGKPKGAVNLHRGLINRLLWTQSRYPIGDNDVMLQKTTITFDDSLCELLWWSLFGATLIMLENEDEKDPAAMCRAIFRHGVTIMYFVPTVLSFFIDTVESAGLYDQIQSLRYVFVSGEELKPEHVRDFHRMMKKTGKEIPLTNTYGPTEASIDCTYFVCDQNYEEIPIGRPMTDTQIYIMQGDRLCGPGVPGELCVAGLYVGAGYLNRSDLTGQVFVQNPFGQGTMYRTGDLAVWRTDGNIRFLGRMDEQVKIHGQRIELGEVESRIKELAPIKDCIVVARSDQGGAKALYAYYVAEQSCSAGEIRDQLSGSLPDYMIPTYMMQIESIPTTKNGKVDKRALPDIKLESQNEYVAPESDEEQALQSAFSNILGYSPISMNDNFFTLGGDSIKAIRVVSKVRESGYELTVKNIMREKTIRRIALQMQKADLVKYEQGEIYGESDLLPAQRALLSGGLQEVHHYNQSLFFEFDGHVDENAFRKGMAAVVAHHDALRAVFSDGKQMIKKVEESRLFELDIVNLSKAGDPSEAIERTCMRIQQSMNLKEGPLVKTCIFKQEPNDHVFFCIHHLVVDGVSWRIIMEDFVRGYNLALCEEEIVLPAKTASVRDWSLYLSKYRADVRNRKEISYWDIVTERLVKAGFQLERDREKSGFVSNCFRIDAHNSKKMRMQSNQAYHTDMQDLLLSAFSIAVHKTTGQKSIGIDLEGHGRDNFAEKMDVDRTVGFFTSTYPVIATCEDTLSETITSNKEMLRSIPNHGSGYGVLYPDGKHSDILLNYLGDYNELPAEDGVLLQMSGYSHGRDISYKNDLSYPIILNCYILNGETVFELTCTNSFRPKELESFTKNLERSVRELIDHCCSVSGTTKTGSDFGDSSISMEDLGALDDLLLSL